VFIVAGATKEETNARITGFRSIRDGKLAGMFGGDKRGPPASTLLVVSALADPRYLVEVEAEAVQ
jgi:hypothetical protein